MTSESSSEAIRTTKFDLARRGYDPGQVDAFLAKVADWLETGGTDEARAEVVRREIERVGERTASILASAEDAAQQLRGDTEREVAELLDRAQSERKRVGDEADNYAATVRGEAEKYSATLRADADSYSNKTRGEADAYARNTRETMDAELERKGVVADQRATEVIEAAEEKARRIVNDGEKRRREIEVVVADLVEHRDQVIATTNDLAAKLQSLAAGHTPEAGADPFEPPRELEPDEGGESAESVRT